MKNSCRCITVFFSGVLFFLLGAGLPAQAPDPGLPFDSPETSILEYYLDKADRQDLEDRWLWYARYGLEAALAAWETDALVLMGEDFDLTAYRGGAENELNDTLERRFAVWLTDRVFSGLQPLSSGEMGSDIARLNHAYLYEKDENGELIRDEKGDAVYKTAIDFTDEKRLWSEETREAIEDLLACRHGEMVTAGDELLSSVSDPELKKYIGQAYNRKFEAWEENYRDELYRLYYREQSRFVQLRLYDQRSLERLTEQQTAEYISNQLIAQTETRLEAGLENLMAGLEARAELPSGSEEEVDTDGWMESFRILLESGLEAWDEAEEELLMERVQWEQISGREILKAEEEWAEAFRTLQEKRSEWMDSYRETLQEGNRLWALESASLESVIQNAVAELDEHLEHEKASLQDRMDTLIGMLLQSVNMMRTARTSWEYWMDQYDGGGMGSFDPSGVAFDTWAMRRAGVEALLKSTGNGDSMDIILHALDWLEEHSGEGPWYEDISPGDILDIFNSYEPFILLNPLEKDEALGTLTHTLDGLSEMIRNALAGTSGSVSLSESFYWTEEIFAVYQAWARDAQQRLGEMYGIVVFDDDSLRTAFDENGGLADRLLASGEVSEGRGLVDSTLLYDDDLWERLYLDPYQVEILKARAYMQYWEKQERIAGAVCDYAMDHSSSKEEASVTEGKLAEAKERYDGVLEEYRELIEDLEGTGRALEERQAEMETLGQEISEAQEKLSEAREKLALLFGDLSAGDPGFLAGQYRSYYLELLAAFGMDGTGGTEGLGAAFEEYLLAAKTYGLEEEISLVTEGVLSLLSGEEEADLLSVYFNPGAASLKELHHRAEDAAGAGFTADPLEGEKRGLFVLGEQAEYEFDEYLKHTLHLDMKDYRYDRLLGLYDRYYNDGETAAGEILWRMQRIARDIRTAVRRDYELRLARIRLLTCETLEDWVDRYLPGTNTEGVASTEDLYELLTAGETGTPLGTVLSAVEGDKAVYEGILRSYNAWITEEGEGDFTLYAWDGGGETLTTPQGLQCLWDYRLEAAGGDEAAAMEEITRITGALETLYGYLSGLGDFKAHTEDLEDALLYGHYLDEFLGEQGITEEQRNSYHFLRAYLNGSGALVTDEENLRDYFRWTESRAEEMKDALRDVLKDARGEAPVLAAMAREAAVDSLVAWLTDQGLVEDDGVSFRRPETVWNAAGFGSIEEVVLWFLELDRKLESVENSLPSYVYEELAGCIGELKDYSALKAAQTWPEDVPSDPDALNEAIRISSDQNGNMNALLNFLMMADSTEDPVAFMEILARLDISDPLYARTAKQFVMTCGFDIARQASPVADFSGTEEEWSALLDAYLYDTGLAGKPGTGDWYMPVMEAVRELYECALAITVAEETDWTGVPEEWRDIYLAGLWNSLDFEEALSRCSGEGAAVGRESLEFLRMVDERLDGAEADGLPEDTVLHWVYRGEEALREFDGLIEDGCVAEWAEETHDFAADISRRYYPLGLTAEELELVPIDTMEAAGEYGLLRLYARLSLIHENLVAEGGYDEEFGAEEMIAGMTSKLDLDAGDRDLLFSLVDGETRTLNAWFTKKEESADTAVLSGEDLYWNLVWKSRTALTEGGYVEEDFRESWIFGYGCGPALSLKYWLEENRRLETAGLRDEYSSMLSALAPDLLILARKPLGQVYADILRFGLEAALLESEGYGGSEAEAMTAWFLDEAGVTSGDGRTIDEYMAVETGSRLLWILEDDPGALEHYMKRLVLTRGLERADIREMLAGVSGQVPEDEVYAFLSMFETARSYNRLLHGELNEYLEETCGGDFDRQFEVRSIYERFMGSDRSTWDDPVFMIDTGLEDRSVADLLESLARNRTRSLADTLSGGGGPVAASGGQSVNGVFLNMVRERVLRAVTGEKGLAARLAEARARKDLAVRSYTWTQSVETGGRDHWRSFLNSEHLVSEEDDRTCIPGETVTADHEDYGRDLVIGDTGNETALEKYAGPKPFLQTGDEKENFLLDAANGYLDRAAFLVGALEMWETAEGTEVSAGNGDLDILICHLLDTPDGRFFIDGEEYESAWGYLEGLDYTDLCDVYMHDMDAGISADYHRTHSVYRGILSRIEGLKDSLGLFGRRREIVQRLADAGEDEISGVLLPLRREITDLEADIAESRWKWQDLIDREHDGYRYLEEAYARDYSRAREAFDALDGAKQEYLLARAIYDYATAGYIGTGDDVTPVGRLDYVGNKAERARTAYDALVHVVNENIAHYDIYEKSPEYRSLFEAYLTGFRESLVLKKMNQIMNKAVARQESVTREALEDWNTARRESYRPISIRDSAGEVLLPDTLDGMGLKKQTDGTWLLTWGSGDVTDEEAVAYFEAEDDPGGGMSAFEEDLVKWISAIYELQGTNGSQLEETMTRWGMALLWEEYLEEGDAFLSNYLDQVKEDDLDREGAEALLLGRWEESYNTRFSGMTDGPWMYDFYRLLDRSGSMATETENGNGEATFTDYAEIESIILANEYMARGKEEEGRRLVLASLPVVALAAVYYGMAVAAASVLPFGWVAAIPLLAIFTFLMVQGASLSGEGNMLKAAARRIQSVVSENEIRKNVMFEDFKNNTADITRRQQVYERELSELEAMKVETESGETLNDEEQVSRLIDSVMRAFEVENEDLGGLLKKTGLVTDSGNEQDPEVQAEALAELFGLYRERMSESEKLEAATSRSLIAALEKEAAETQMESSRKMNDYLMGENGAARRQNEAYETYRRAYQRCMMEEITGDEFIETVEAVFADPVFSTREHMLRLFEGRDEIARNILGDAPFGSDVSAELLYDQRALLTGTTDNMGILDYRQEACRQVKIHELTMLRLQMAERRRQWEDQMSAIIARGQFEWTAGTRKMRSRYEAWCEETGRNYTRQRAAWNDKYLDFIDDKLAWQDAVRVQSTRYGDTEVLDNFGKMTRGAVDAAGKDVVTGVFRARVEDPDIILSRIVDLECLDTLLQNAVSLNSGIDPVKGVMFTAAGPDSVTAADTLQAIKDYQGARNEEYERHLAELEFRVLLDRVAGAQENFYLQIERANERVKKGLHDTLRGDGYILAGNVYSKELVTGATVQDYIKDTGTVRRYRYYMPEAVDFGGDLKAQEGNAGKMSSESLKAFLDEAVKAIETKTTEIFGDSEDAETFLLRDDLEENNGTRKDGEATVIDREYYDFIQEIESLDENGLAVRTCRGVNMSPGLFGDHVGYAPGFSEHPDSELPWDAPGQVEFEGRGEMGVIMGQFIFNKIREKRGWSEVNSPHYEKRLWDDTGSWFEAPTVKDLAELSTSALSVATGGMAGVANAALAGYCIGLVDDAVFTLADVDRGLMTGDEGLVSFGKTAAASAMTIFGGGVGAAGDTVFEAALAGLGSRFVTTAATGTVGSVTYSSGNGFGFDGDAFADALFGETALAGYMETFASGLVTGGLNSRFNTVSSNGFDLGNLDLGQEQIGRVMSMIGGIAGEAAGSFIDKDFTLNLLNTADLAAPGGNSEALSGSRGMGLFEMHFGRDEQGGFSGYGTLGSDGAKIQYRDLVFNGGNVLQNIQRIRSINNDTASAAKNADTILETEGRAIGLDEITFSGESEVAELLSRQLETYRVNRSGENIMNLMNNRGDVIARSFLEEGVGCLEGDGVLAEAARLILERNRGEMSYDNLIAMFESSARGELYGEKTMDSNLLLAFAQGDISLDQFMDNGIFDTGGSFQLAHDLYSGNFGDGAAGLVTLARLFESGKAFAGDIHDPEARSGMIEQKAALVQAYYAEDISDADALLGGDYFDARAHIYDRITGNEMPLIGAELGALGQAHRDHRALVTAVTGYDEKTSDYNKGEFDKLKTRWMASAVAAGVLARENGISLHSDHADLGCNPVMNDAGTASSPVYGGSLVTTLYGQDTITFSLAEATGRTLYSNRKHQGWDITLGPGERQAGGGTLYFTSPASGALDVGWNPEGTGIEIMITTAEYRHVLGHNYTGSLDILTDLMITGAGTDVAAGSVLGKYQDFLTNKSTGQHVDWRIFSLKTDTTGNVRAQTYDNQDWIDAAWGAPSPFVIPGSVLHLSGKPLENSYAENRELVRMYAPGEYWMAEGMEAFGIPTRTEREYYGYLLASRMEMLGIGSY